MDTGKVESRASSVSPPLRERDDDIGSAGRLSLLVASNSDHDALMRTVAKGAAVPSAIFKRRNSRSNVTSQMGAAAGQLGVPLSSQSAAVRAAATPQLSLHHLSVEETIHLRNIFDRFSTIEGGEVPLLVGSIPGDSLLQCTVSRRLDIFSVTTLLHHARVVDALPPDAELRRIILRVTVANAQMTARPVPIADEENFSPSVEPVLQFPSELTFQIFLQIAELVKRWSVRDNDEDDAAKTFAYLSKNRKYIKPVDETFLQQLSHGKVVLFPASVPATSAVSPSAQVLTAPSDSLAYPFSPGMFDLEHKRSTNASVEEPSLGLSGVGAPSAALQSANHLTVKQFRDLLSSAGAEYDFLTLFSSIDPSFEGHDASRVDVKQYRWLGGVDDPDVVNAFVALGGEPSLSGTITVDSLIAKCEAMQMTPQYIANFISLVDPNQDGVVDFTEFLALLVRNRQELSGERRGKLTERLTGGATDPFFGIDENPKPSGAKRGSTRTAPNSLHAAALPFPRHKRFSRVDDNTRRSSLPFQGVDEEDLARAEQEALQFQEKVRSIFEGGDVVMIDDEVGSESGLADAVDVTAAQQLDSDSNDTSSDSDEESRRARAARRRTSVQETHLGIGLSGIFQKQERKEKAPPSLSERVELVAKRGSEVIAHQRERVNSALQELEKRQRKLIKMDRILVEANRDGESAIKQLHKAKTQTAERAKRRPMQSMNARVVAMSEHALVELRRDVERMQRGALLSETSTPAPAISRVLSETRRSDEASAAEVAAAAAASATRSAASPDVYSRLYGHHRVPRVVKVSAPPPSRATEASGAHDVGTAVAEPAAAGQWRALSSTSGAISPRPPSGRPGSAVSRGSVTPLPASRAPSAGRAASAAAPQKSAVGEYMRVKLEDPESLWNLLQQSRRREERAHTLADKPESDVAAAIEAHNTRRAFARTIASHLSLRLPYEDVDAIGTRTPSAISHTYLDGTPQVRSVVRSGCGSATPKPATPCSVGGRGSSARYDVQPRAQQQQQVNTIPSRALRAHRPQTAPATGRRPSSARTTRHQHQLARATNRSPAPPTAASPYPTSQNQNKCYGIGGELDIEEGDDDDDNARAD